MNLKDKSTNLTTRKRVIFDSSLLWAFEEDVLFVRALGYRCILSEGNESQLEVVVYDSLDRVHLNQLPRVTRTFLIRSNETRTVETVLITERDISRTFKVLNPKHISNYDKFQYIKI